MANRVWRECEVKLKTKTLAGVILIIILLATSAVKADKATAYFNEYCEHMTELLATVSSLNEERIDQFLKKRGFHPEELSADDLIDEIICDFENKDESLFLCLSELANIVKGQCL